MITFRTVVKQALAKALKRTENDQDLRRFGDVLAEELRAHFRLNGYAVKAGSDLIAQQEQLGRPMTDEEQLRLLGDGQVPRVRQEDAAQGLPEPPDDAQDDRLPAAGRRDESPVRHGRVRHHQRSAAAPEGDG